jgi:hypothetical protein
MEYSSSADSFSLPFLFSTLFDIILDSEKIILFSLFFKLEGLNEGQFIFIIKFLNSLLFDLVFDSKYEFNLLLLISVFENAFIFSFSSTTKFLFDPFVLFLLFTFILL